MASLFLPEGASVFPEELQRKVQVYNPNYFFRVCAGLGCRNRNCDSWILAEAMDTGAVKARAHSKTNHAPESILPILEARLSDRAENPADEIERENEKVRKELAAKSDAVAENAADRLRSALKRG